MNTENVWKIITAVVAAAVIWFGGWINGTSSRVQRMEIGLETLQESSKKQWERSGDRITYHEVVELLFKQDTRDDGQDNDIHEIQKRLEHHKGYEDGIRARKEQ